MKTITESEENHVKQVKDLAAIFENLGKKPKAKTVNFADAGHLEESPNGGA